MNKPSGIVEINGNRYDAATGQMMGSVKKSAHHLKSSASGMVDGIIRQSSHVSAKKKVATLRAKHTAQTFHKSTQRSRTLMRTAVHKPIQPEAKKPSNTPLSYVPSAEAKKHTNRRFERAKTFARDNRVSRFGQAHKVSKNHPQPRSGELAEHKRLEAKASIAVPKSLVASASHSQVERLLDQALVSNASKNSAPGRRRPDHGAKNRIRLLPKWLSLGVVALGLTIFVGFFASKNIPEVAVKVAASRANVNATVPSYAPEGYSFAAPISYSKGQVSLSYQAENGQSYQITQQTSKLDSASLASSVLSAESNVQTSQVKGNTVYIYGDENHATWVNNGVRYTIIDKAGLDSNQLLEIAGSL